MNQILLMPLLALAGSAVAAQTEKPNIIWVMAEDMGQDLECYGMQAVRTPVLNRMAQQGVQYNNACCSAPISSPSRSAMMTGVHQTIINSHNHRSNRDMLLADGVKPITYYLREAGYTCILGNTNVMGRGRKTDCNFKHTPLGQWNGVDKFGLFDKNDEFTAADQPFFAQIQLVVTHRGDWWKTVSAESKHRVDPTDIALPPYMANHPKIREEWASYLDQVEYMDNEMGILLQELKDKGVIDNTIIFFIADNGRCDIKGKGYLYEPGTKIPMIAWGKGIEPGVVNDIVSTLDISASILDFAGINLPDYLSGKPLFKKGKSTASSDYFYAARDSWDEIIDCMRSISTTKFTYIRNYVPQYGWDRHQTYLDFHRPAVHVMRQLKADGKLNANELLFFADKKPAEELYDIVNDPHQLRNLAGDAKYSSTLKQLSSLMDRWQTEHKDMGLLDLSSRTSNGGGGIREWVKKNYPQEWLKLTQGEIGDSFQKWNEQMAVGVSDEQQTQRSVTLLDKGWAFTRQDDAKFSERDYDHSSWQKVEVPHDWAIEGPFDMSIDAQQVMVVEDGEKKAQLRTGRTGALPFIGTGWYRRVLKADPSLKNKICNIELDGAMSGAKVYINGKFAAERPYGYSSFSVDVTPFLDRDKDNVVAVRLENKAESSRWYPGAGLYRNVRFVSVDPLHVAQWGTYITTPSVTDTTATVSIQTKLNNFEQQSGATLVTTILDANNKVVGKAKSAIDNVKTSTIEQTIEIKNPKLWSIESPELYRVESVISKDKQSIDMFKSQFGIRTINFDANKGFTLNGERIKIKGVCQHHDLGPLGAAINVRAIERQLEILKEMGCNAIRMSHNPPAPELLDLCDKMGFLVMDESFDEWKMGKNANGYSNLFDQWAEKDLTTMIHRDRNHPSVILWSIGNEIREQSSKDGAQVARFLTDICHREDPTRLVTAGLNTYDNALKNGFADVIDVFGFNYKPFAYEDVHKRYPNLKLIGAETASTVSSRGVYHLPVIESKEPFHADYQCSSYDLEYPRWASTPDTEFAAQDDYDFMAGEFVWTGFDYLGEPTPYNDNTPARSSYFGIVDLVGMKKDRFYLYQSRWSDKDVLHTLPHWNWSGHEGKVVPVHCYTNMDKVELFLNGKSLGVKSKDATDKSQRFRIVWDNVVYQPGELKSVGYDASGKKVTEYIVKTAGAPDHMVLNADRNTITADGKDLSFIEVTIVDKDGIACPLDNTELSFEVINNGALVALCNGDATSHESFKGTQMRAFSGKCMAIVGKSKKSGTIKLLVKGKGLPTAEIDVKTTKP